MKHIPLIILFLAAAALSGCATGDPAYKVNKAMWGVGNWDEVKDYHESNLDGFEYIEANK